MSAFFFIKKGNFRLEFLRQMFVVVQQNANIKWRRVFRDDTRYQAENIDEIFTMP